MSLPSPRTKLANCVWLPRVWTKAKLIASGGLADEYAPFFCHPKGVDGQFLSFFSIERDQITGIASFTADEVQTWFLELPQVNPARIEEWNQVAENLGRPGFPMHDRLKAGLEGGYSHVAHLNPKTVFEVLEVDDAQFAVEKNTA